MRILTHFFTCPLMPALSCSPNRKRPTTRAHEMPSFKINTYSTIPEALDLLSEKTKRCWNISDFFDAIMRHSLPLESATPNTARVIVSGYGGALTASAGIGWRAALLCTYQVKRLWLTGETETSYPALEPGDDDYCSWNTIKKWRADQSADTPALSISTEKNLTGKEVSGPGPGNKAWVINNQKLPEYIERPIEYGEWMGESDIFFFEDPASVTIDTVCVPMHTLAELLNMDHSDLLIDTPSRGEQTISSAPSTSITTHKIKNRSHPLDTEIALARSTALDPENPESVFAELVKLADIRHGCLIGPAENSVKYRDGGDVRTFFKRNLRDRMQRAKTR